MFGKSCPSRIRSKILFWNAADCSVCTWAALAGWGGVMQSVNSHKAQYNKTLLELIMLILFTEWNLIHIPDY